MKRIVLVMCLIFVWYFVYTSGGGSRPATVIGPFPDEGVCNSIKKIMTGFKTYCWEVE